MFRKYSQLLRRCATSSWGLFFAIHCLKLHVFIPMRSKSPASDFLWKMSHSNFLRIMNHTNFQRKMNHSNFLRKMNHSNFLRKRYHSNFLRKIEPCKFSAKNEPHKFSAKNCPGVSMSRKPTFDYLWASVPLKGDSENLIFRFERLWRTFPTQILMALCETSKQIFQMLGTEECGSPNLTCVALRCLKAEFASPCSG